MSRRNLEAEEIEKEKAWEKQGRVKWWENKCQGLKEKCQNGKVKMNREKKKG